MILKWLSIFMRKLLTTWHKATFKTQHNTNTTQQISWQGLDTRQYHQALGGMQQIHVLLSNFTRLHFKWAETTKLSPGEAIDSDDVIEICPPSCLPNLLMSMPPDDPGWLVEACNKFKFIHANSISPNVLITFKWNKIAFKWEKWLKLSCSKRQSCYFYKQG